MCARAQTILKVTTYQQIQTVTVDVAFSPRRVVAGGRGFRGAGRGENGRIEQPKQTGATAGGAPMALVDRLGENQKRHIIFPG